MIKGIANDFKHETVDGQEIINYINKKSGKDFTNFFNQYLKNKEIPSFQYNLHKRGETLHFSCTDGKQFLNLTCLF